MTYLSRPVLTIKPNWLRQPVQEFSFDLRGIRRGFGSSTFSPTASHVARGWSMEFTFPTTSDYAALTDFLGDRFGRLDGFWMPNMARQFVVVTGTSNTVFEIETQNIDGTWADDASVHLYAIIPGGTTVAVAITNVETPSSGVERITVGTSLGGTPTADWQFFRLLYVRLADDSEKSVAHGEGMYSQEVKVIELPEEYAAAETGQSPVYLYDFWQDNGDTTEYHWRFTSFAKNFTSSGDTFNAFNLNHGAISHSTRADRTEIQIETTFDADAPWALQLPFPSTRPLMLNLYEVTYTLPNARRLYFSGECSGISFSGNDTTLKFDHWFDAMRRQLPGRTIQPRCHYHFGDQDTCKADLASFIDPDFINAVTIDDIDGREISVSTAKFASDPGDYPINFFANGRIRVGIEPMIEERMVVASSAATGGGVVLVVSQRLVHQTAPVAATLFRGCNQYYATCKSFGNELHYPGFPDVPRVNPTFKAIEVASGTAGKK